MGANSGRILSPEWRKKIGEAQKGRKQSEETKTKRRNTLIAFGVYEHKQIVSGMLKQCSKCRQELEVSSNFNRRMRKDAFGVEYNIWQSRCIACNKESHGVCSNCGRDKKLQKGKCSACYFKLHIATDPVRLKNFQLTARIRHLLKKYGISLDKYDAMLDEQRGGCAICGSKDNGRTQDGKSDLPFMVDHDHTTGKVRALLCATCNFLVGLLEANPVRYEAAKAYILRYKETE